MVEYIERDGVLAEYDRHHQGPPGGARKIIAEYPAADVKPVVRGSWTRFDYFPVGHDYECSKCGYMNDMMSNYCPNCGADMRTQEPKQEPDTKPTTYDLLHEEGGWNLQ